MKLKIPIYVTEEEDNKFFGSDDDNVDLNDQKKIQSKERVCQVCNKVFGSGKALGGHMRIHFQAYKNLMLKKKMRAQQSIKFKKLKKSSKSDSQDQFGSFKKLKKSSKSISLDQFGSSVEPTCALCFKIFPSMKSLFGHMRCHPEREWRGIHPPPSPPPSPSPSPLLHANNSSVSWSTNSNGELIDDDLAGEKAVLEQVDLLEVLPKWSVTAKRGRKAAKMVDYDDAEEEFLEAADDLLMLAKGGVNSCDHLSSDLTQKHQKGESYEVTNSNSLSNNKTIEFIVGHHHHQTLMNEVVNREEGKGSSDDGANTNKDVLMKSAGKCNEKNVVESDDEFESSDSCLIGKKGMIIKNKKERKKMKLRDLDQIQDSFPEKHKCSNCGKSFSTHQALGGHKSSHCKFRMFIQNSIDDDQYHSPPSAQCISVQDEVVNHTLDFDLNELPQLE